MGFGIPDFVKDTISDVAGGVVDVVDVVVDNPVTRDIVSAAESFGGHARDFGGVLDDVARYVGGELRELPGEIHEVGLDNSGFYRAADGIVSDIVAEAQEADGFDISSIAASGGIRIAQAVADDIVDPIIAPDRQTIGYDELSPDLQSHVETVFGGSFDPSEVRFIQGGSSTDVIAPHVVGNTVYLPGGYLNEQADGTYNAEYVRDDGTIRNRDNLIAHELGHVWQNQNGGGDYAHQALYHQFVAALPNVHPEALGDLGDIFSSRPGVPGFSGPEIGEVFDNLVDAGDRNEAYRGAEALTSGTPFAELNPEEQADVIDHLARMGGVPTEANIPVSPPPGRTANEVVADWNAALDAIQNGQHAP